MSYFFLEIQIVHSNFRGHQLVKEGAKEVLERGSLRCCHTVFHIDKFET